MPPLVTCCVAIALSAMATAPEPDAPLAEYFGFGEIEIVRIDRGAGPMTVADVDGDGFGDLVVVNNYASRIEVHYQRPGASPDDEILRIVRSRCTPCLERCQGRIHWLPRLRRVKRLRRTSWLVRATRARFLRVGRW